MLIIRCRLLNKKARKKKGNVKKNTKKNSNSSVTREIRLPITLQKKKGTQIKKPSTKGFFHNQMCSRLFNDLTPNSFRSHEQEIDHDNRSHNATQTMFMSWGPWLLIAVTVAIVLIFIYFTASSHNIDIGHTTNTQYQTTNVSNITYNVCYLVYVNNVNNMDVT